MFVSNTTFIMHQPKKQKETFKTVADFGSNMVQNHVT